MSETGTAVDSCGRVALTRDGRRLEWLTLGWNAIEAIIAITAGALAGSIALVGFGADSVIESLSGLALLWRLQSHEADEHRERLALRLVGASFLILALYVGIDASISLYRHMPPEVSPAGVALAALSLLIMPVLANAKRRVARQLDSPALAADSRQTDLCAYLSAILLVGLGVHAVFGWWWADPVAALAMTPLIVWEGAQAFRGRSCCNCH